MSQAASPSKTDALGPTNSSLNASAGGAGADGSEEVYKSKVKSCVRVRPFKGNDAELCVRPGPRTGAEKTIEIITPDGQQAPQNPFRTFDEIFWSLDPAPPLSTIASNKDIFERVGKPCIEKAFKGINSVVFAYGQTASGKSYTMGLGDASETDPGLIPLLVDDLFAQIKAGGPPLPPAVAAAKMSRVYEVKLGFYEVYDDHLNGGKVKDLNPYPPASLADLTALRKEVQKAFDAQASRDPKISFSDMSTCVKRVWKSAPADEVSTRTKLVFDYRDRADIDAMAFSANMRRLEDIAGRDGGVIAGHKNDLFHNLQTDEWAAKGLAERPVASLTDVKGLLTSGSANRRTGATDFNLHSSRSHAVVQLRVTAFYVQDNADGSTGEKEEYTSATVNLVDLAGSERLNKVGISRLSETKSINLSLMYLGQVIDAASERGRSQDTMAKMRMMTLTRLMSSSFGGNSETWMLACVNPSMTEWSETVNTLNYAGKARNIVNSMRQNKSANEGLEAKLLALRQALLAGGAGATSEEAKRLQDQIEALQTLQTSMQDGLRADREALENEQRQIREIESERIKEAEEYRSKLSERELAITKAHQALVETKGKLEEQQGAVARLQAQAAEKETEFEAAKAAQDAWLEKELAQIQASIATSDERAAAARAAREAHSSSLEDVRRKVEETQRDLTDAKVRAANLADQTKALQDGDGARAKELSEQQHRLERQLKEMSELQRRNQYKQLDLDQVERELAELDNEIATKEAQVEAGKAQLEERKAELEARDEQLRAKEDELRVKEEEMAEIEKRQKEVEVEIRAMEQSISAIEQNTRERRRLLDEKQKERMELDEKVREFYDKVVVGGGRI